MTRLSECVNPVVSYGDVYVFMAEKEKEVIVIHNVYWHEIEVLDRVFWRCGYDVSFVKRQKEEKR